MTNTVIVSQAFKRDAKTLPKKFHSLKNSIDNLIISLIENPYLGNSYGDNIYKIRLADKSKGGGKSGGFRVMYYHLSISDEGIDIILMTIFDKSEKSSVKKDEALKKLKAILSELEI